MFDQTFVPAGRPAAARSLLVSFTIQISALTALALASIVFTQALPFRPLHGLVIAPRPPVPIRVSATQPPKPTRRPAFNPLHLQPPSVPVVRTREGHTAVAPTITAGNTDPMLDASSAIRTVFGAPTVGSPQPPRAAQSFEPQRSAGPLRIGGSVAAANLIERVVPTYPRIAAAAGIRGAVEFSAVIDRDGRIMNLKLRRGHPLLVRAATEAVLKWRYRPTLLNGVPVEVATDITVQFNLSNANGR